MSEKSTAASAWPTRTASWACSSGDGGRGYLEALNASSETVWSLLFECITNDPRLDPQCEWRQEYYAGLILGTGMDLEPLRSHLRKNDAECRDSTLVLTTLLCLAGEHRDAKALDLLQEYLSYGREWVPIVYDLGEMGTPDALAGIVEVLCRRVGSEPDFRSEFEEAVRDA